MRAAILRAHNEPLEVRDDVVIADPGPGQLKVKVGASGVCHSDVSFWNGTVPVPMPVVPGHEGAGTVTAIGAGVNGINVGDHVICSFMPTCGACAACLRNERNLCLQGYGLLPGDVFSAGGESFGGVTGLGTFAEELIIPLEAAVPIPADVPFDVAALVGCGVMTGVGAAINTAKVTPGSTVVVIGCGGVGSNVIQGARAAGAAVILAVDMVASKLESAQQFGATHTCTPDQLNDQKVALTGGEGFDFGFEVIGLSSTIRSTYDAVRRGGTACIVGMGSPVDNVQFNAFELFFNEKNLKGSMYGSANVKTDFHRLLKMWHAGQLDLDGLITRRIDLSEINDAFRAMQAGEVVRSVIIY